MNVDNIRTVESHIQFVRYQKIAGGFNKWYHIFTALDVDNQPTIVINHDPLNSVVIVDAKKPVKHSQKGNTHLTYRKVK